MSVVEYWCIEIGRYYDVVLTSVSTILDADVRPAPGGGLSYRGHTLTAATGQVPGSYNEDRTGQLLLQCPQCDIQRQVIQVIKQWSNAVCNYYSNHTAHI